MANKDLRIIPLFEKPDLVDACAAWSYGEWGSQNPDSSLEESLQRYRERITDPASPLWILLNNTGKPIAMAGLRDFDHPDRTDLKPWLTRVFVHPYYRRKGLAQKLISFVEQQAISMFNHRTLYLYSSSDGETLYKKLGWTVIGTVRDLAGLDHAGKLLMKKDLNHV